MSHVGAVVLALVALAAAPPVAPAAAPAAPASSVFGGVALEVRADGTLGALEPPGAPVPGDAGAGPAEVTRVDLVWGCRGDRRRARLLEGDPLPGVAPPDACVARVDVRPPCAPAIDDAGLDDDDARALAAAAAELHRGATGAYQQRMARLGAGFSQWGPGLRLVVTGGGPLTLTTTSLGLEACECDGASARPLGDEHVTVVLPRLAGPTVLWWPVPRYLGALHRLDVTPAPASGALSFVDPFHAEDDGAAEPSNATPSAFSAPAGCDCAPCGALE